MEWPQIIVLLIFGADFGLHTVRHGQVKEGKYNFWVSMIGDAVLASLLIAGGFFKAG
jgi:hypothetical protein